MYIFLKTNCFDLIFRKPCLTSHLRPRVSWSYSTWETLLLKSSFQAVRSSLFLELRYFMFFNVFPIIKSLNIQYLMHTYLFSKLFFAVSTFFIFFFGTNLQASEDYFQFESEQIVVSVGNPSVTKSVLLTKEKRQTLLIPSAINDEWLLVRDHHKII